MEKLKWTELKDKFFDLFVWIDNRLALVLLLDDSKVKVVLFGKYCNYYDKAW